MGIKCPKCHSDNTDTAPFCSNCATPLLSSEKILISQTKTLQTSMKELAKGTTFAGRYKLIKELGRGGMGVVYKAEDTRLKRTVALKFLPSEITHVSEVKERFIREAQAAAALDHPNICTVYEIDEAEEKTFISMAYVEGQSLKEKIDKGPLKLDEALEIATRVAAGLEEAHKKRIVHRDIKSANIMVTGKAQVKIMDFGLAKVAGKPTITKEGTSMGTIAYMSPEQAQGKAVDHRTDIWSFGVMLYEMVTGQRPFKGDYEQGVVYSILNEEPEPMTGLRTGVPMGLERIVNKAIAKNVEERYQHVDEMMVDLRSIAKELEAETSKARLAKAVRQETRVSFFKDLLQRRVPQIMGIYFAGHLGIIIFMDWMVHRYPLSPHLPKFCLIALFSIIPTILLLAYFHGRSGRFQWRRAEKIGIPINLFLSAGLLFFLFQGKDLGATTKTVTLTDEEGQTTERVIPKSEFRKKVALFYFDNKSGDLYSSWLQYGIVKGLVTDLAQDLYLDISSGFSSELKEAGFKGSTEVPLTLKRKIAYDQHLDYFVSGSFTKDNEQFSVKTSLYETKRTKLLEERAFTGKDIFKLIDEMSVQLKYDLKIPAYHIEETEDKPASEMLTNSMYAFNKYVVGTNIGGEMRTKHLEQAVEDDPTFAYAWFELYVAYAFSNQSEKAETAIRAAMRYDYRLLEKDKYNVKYNYYSHIKQDQDLAFTLLNMRVELFPQDIDGHKGLAKLYENRNQPDEAISEYKRILELDPRQYECFHYIGRIYEQKGEHEEALQNYEQYADQFPNDYRSFTRIGQLYKTIGDYEHAKSYYKKALLIETEKISVLLTLANIESELGNFKQAIEQYQDVLKISKTPGDRVEVYNSLISFYERKGQISKSLEYMQLAFADMEKSAPPLLVLIYRMKALVNYIMAGKKDVAFQAIKAIEEQIAPPFNKFIPLGYLLIYLELEDVDNAEKAIEGLEAAIRAFKAEILRPIVLHAQGMICEMRGEYEQTILSYQKQLELDPTDSTINRSIGRCYRKLKDLKKAKEYMQKTLKIHPFEPKTNYETALIYYDMGKKEKAMEHLKEALHVWEEADPEYKPAKKAKEKLVEWESYISKVK